MVIDNLDMVDHLVTDYNRGWQPFEDTMYNVCVCMCSERERERESGREKLIQ